MNWKTNKVLMIAIITLAVSGAGSHAQSGMMEGQQGQMGGMGDGKMMEKPQNNSERIKSMDPGELTFTTDCESCHPSGRQAGPSDRLLTDSRMLTNYRVFLRFLREPGKSDGTRGEMPAFSESRLSDQKVRELYHYITATEGPGMRGGYRGYRMRHMYDYGRGSGMGPGWIGGYGRGYNLGPGYYMLSPECQKFYDETAKLRKELSDKSFDYFEALRNPRTTGRVITDLEEELWALQDKIFSQAPLSCDW